MANGMKDFDDRGGDGGDGVFIPANRVSNRTHDAPRHHSAAKRGM